VFSWDRIDRGSKLLTENLPRLSGEGADFGAGIGYLSHHILQNAPSITKLHVLEADARALACARENLGDFAIFGWEDLTKPVASLGKLDFIVMNPPFHEGKKTQIPLGRDFVRTAAHHLKKGGKLWMVANAHLPYEDLVRAEFTDVHFTLQKDGFKLIGATR